MKNYYLILGLDENADYSAIKSAYRDRCKNCHPDTSACDGEEFRNIHDAYEVLSDPIRRRKYDRELIRSRIRQSNSKEEGESIPIRRSTTAGERGKSTGRHDFFGDDIFSRFSFLFENFFSFPGTPFSEEGLDQNMYPPSPGRFYRDELACQLVLSPEEAREGGIFSIPLPTRPKRTVRIEIPYRVREGEEFHFHLGISSSERVFLKVTVLVER